MTVRIHEIVAQLIEFGRTVGANELVFNNDPLIGNLIKNDPFAYLLAASVDRGMQAETAWQLPGKIREILGHLDPAKIAQMSSDDMLALLERVKGKPRYLTDAAKTIVDLAGQVAKDYGGDARNLWRGQRAWEIQRRMERVYGVGPGIASMTVNLLSSLGEIQLEAEDYATMDVKPDVHLKRVFGRLGLCSAEVTENELVDAARRLYPTYPGMLDAPAWHIGREWCHPKEPKCNACPMNDVCPKYI